MTSRVAYYVVVRESNPTKVLKGIPSIALISAGGGQAYYIPSETPGGEGIWYLRDDARGYTPEAHGGAAGDYSQVRVIRNPKDRS